MWDKILPTQRSFQCHSFFLFQCKKYTVIQLWLKTATTAELALLSKAVSLLASLTITPCLLLLKAAYSGGSLAMSSSEASENSFCRRLPRWMGTVSKWKSYRSSSSAGLSFLHSNLGFCCRWFLPEYISVQIQAEALVTCVSSPEKKSLLVPICASWMLCIGALSQAGPPPAVNQLQVLSWASLQSHSASNFYAVWR